MSAEHTAALCAVVKDEGISILEWIAYHEIIGFDRICIYDNGSAAGFARLLQMLAEGHVIDLYNWPSVLGVAPQRAAYADALQRLDTEWAAFLDADEFLNLKQDNSIGEFLGRFNENVSAVAVNWRVFGSSGHPEASSELVMKRFTLASRLNAPVNTHCKTIARIRDIRGMHIHFCCLSGGLYVDEAAHPVKIEAMGRTPVARHEFCQINHYVIKSRAEYEDKRKRGNANRPDDAPDKFARTTEGFFRAHDLNDETDASILRFEERVTARVKALRHLSGTVE